MDLQSVMKQREAWEHPKMRAVNARRGAGENQFGVNLGKLRGLAGKINRDHNLALELWQSGNIDAMNLATLIAVDTRSCASARLPSATSWKC